MKIFITGGSGLLGQYLNIELNKKHELLTQYNLNIGNCSSFNSVKISIIDYEMLNRIFDEFKPDVVVHLASVSNAEKADLLPANLVYEINVNATAKLAQLCSKHNARLIYTSTDLVYAGYRGSNLTEDAKLIPISLYAETKLMSEVKIRQTFDNYVILREALLIGFGLNHSINNFQKMYENLKEGKSVQLFSDQFRTPLALHDSARMICELIENKITGEIMNWGGNSRVSRYEIGEILCEAAAFDKNLLIKTTMAELGLNYQVADVSMNNEKMKSLGINPQSIDDSIKQIIGERY
jgi:dTDP-4-dehydrorhamnose reductase